MFSGGEQQATPQLALERERQNFAVSVRKFHRDEALSKRRNLNSVVEAKVIPINSGDEKLQALIKESLSREVSINDLYSLVRKLEGGNMYDWHEGMIGIRKLLSVDKMLPIQAVIDANVVPKMIKFMGQSAYPRLQMEAAWALTNIASGTTMQCQSIIDKGGIPLFVNLLRSPHDDVLEQAVWALGNIAGDLPYNRDLIIKAGGVDPLIHLATTSKNLTIIKQSTWALSNLCRGNPPADPKEVERAVPVFVMVLKNNQIDEIDILVDCCWALAYLSDSKTNAVHKMIYEGGGVERLVFFLKSPTVTLLGPTIRVLGNLCSTTNNDLVLEILRNPIFENLLYVMNNDKKALRRQACWVLSNLCAHSMEVCIRILTHPALVARLIELFRDDAAEVKRQIAIMLTSCSDRLKPSDFVDFCRRHQILAILCNNISNTQETKAMLTFLRSVNVFLSVGQKAQINAMNILKEEFNASGGIDKLQTLQLHKSEDVYKEVATIIASYYEIEDPI